MKNEPHTTTTLKTCEIDGKLISYTPDTDFWVQVGFRQGAYQTRYSFKGNPVQACMYYRCINIGRGYKKRLLMPSSPKPVIARYIS